MLNINRRDFLKACCVSATALGVSSRARAWFATPFLPAAASDDTLVVVFLRGAMDGLSLLPPGASSPWRADYEINRVVTRVPISGTGAALTLNGTHWALHPRASGLRDLFNAGHAAFVVAAGQVQPDPVVRSHFEAQNNLEFGVGGGSGGGIGWLTRHLTSGGLPVSVPLPAVSMGSITASSLLGSSDAITMYSGADFRLDSFHWSWRDDDPEHGLTGGVSRMNALWNGANPTQLERAGREALGSLALLRPMDFALYDPVSHPQGYQPEGGANYTLDYNGAFGTQLRNVAQLIKRGVGLRAVTIDLGNWDTHVGQGNPSQSWDWFGNQVSSLSDGLTAFYTDLSAGATNHMQKVSVIVVSEFGRRVQENSDGGTDHGYGNVITVLGGAVNGGIVYGDYPGIGSGELYENVDVDVTTDYRRVISEALIRRLANPNIYYAFPGYSGYTPMGIFQGADLPPTNFDSIFGDGFEVA